MSDENLETNPVVPPNGTVDSLSIRVRLALISCGLVSILLLTLAFRLTPNPKGIGTHQQLGFSQCTFIEWFNVPCPSCGMTTSWSHLMNGQIIQSFRANPGGALLAIYTLLLGPWMLVSGIMGKWLISRLDMGWVFVATVLVTLVTIFQWVIRVVFFPL